MITSIEQLAANVQAYKNTDVASIWRKTRLILGYGVNQLAELLETSGAQISRIESGERQPSIDLIIKFLELKEMTMPNVRFLTDKEIETFPGDNFVDVAIIGTDGVEYYGESDETGNANHQYVNNEDGEHIPVKS